MNDFEYFDYMTIDVAHGDALDRIAEEHGIRRDAYWHPSYGITEETDEEFRKRVLKSLKGSAEIKEVECECGAEKCGSSSHSNWCKKYKN